MWNFQSQSLCSLMDHLWNFVLNGPADHSTVETLLKSFILSQDRQDQEEGVALMGPSQSQPLQIRSAKNPKPSGEAVGVPN